VKQQVKHTITTIQLQQGFASKKWNTSETQEPFSSRVWVQCSYCCSI